MKKKKKKTPKPQAKMMQLEKEKGEMLKGRNVGAKKRTKSCVVCMCV